MKKRVKLTKVKYLPHPISYEDKKKWNAKGYRVIDDRFDPEPKPVRKAKAEPEADGE
jgi:hypothetical protein